jgi:UDP-glucose 4-epimerase
MNIFLTGGTGFIGSYILKALSDEGHKITVLARNPDKVPALRNLPNVQMLKAEINDAKIIEQSIKGHEVCIHVALHWGDTATEMLRKDTYSSVQLFSLAANAGVTEIIYTSSTAVNDWVYMDAGSHAGGEKNTVFENTKQRPVTYYGATKGATELYLNAISFEYKIKCNIVRPGYTFGNPVVEGANTQSDARFRKIVENALLNEDIEVIKNDGTQFIWAGDLAKIYLAVMKADKTGMMYFGLGNRFITWEEIAREALARVHSKSNIIVKDFGWPSKPALFDVSAIKRDFGFSFDAWEQIVQHIDYYVSLLKKHA